MNSELKDAPRALALRLIKSWRPAGRFCNHDSKKITPQPKHRPTWEDEFNKRVTWAYHFSTRLVSMQKERHQLHMQTWTDTCRFKTEKGRLDLRCGTIPWILNELRCIYMEVFPSMGKRDANRILQCITHKLQMWNYHRQGCSAQGQHL